jgi:ribulose-phosphate 3-epimerase
MMEIVPAILAHTEEEFLRKVERIRGLAPLAHVDVMDGIFVANNTWAPVERVEKIMDDLPFSVHLMVANPEHAAPVWAVSGASRVYFHLEATEREHLIMRAVEENDDGTHTIGVTINPDTPISRIAPMLHHLSHVLVMGVMPGFSGQTFEEGTLGKIRELLKLKPDLHITVDGGVKKSNIRAIQDAGAQIVVVGSALTDAPDPAAALKELKNELL